MKLWTWGSKQSHLVSGEVCWSWLAKFTSVCFRQMYLYVTQFSSRVLIYSDSLSLGCLCACLFCLSSESLLWYSVYVTFCFWTLYFSLTLSSRYSYPTPPFSHLLLVIFLFLPFIIIAFIFSLPFFLLSSMYVCVSARACALARRKKWKRKLVVRGRNRRHKQGRK